MRNIPNIVFLKPEIEIKLHQWYVKQLELMRIVGRLPNPTVGEFWRYYDGINIGQEMQKRDWTFLRLCLIITKNTGNGLVFVTPLSTAKQKYHNQYIKEIENWQRYIPKKSCLIINQSKFIDKRRLFKVSDEMKGPYPRKEIKEVQECFKKIFE